MKFCINDYKRIACLQEKFLTGRMKKKNFSAFIKNYLDKHLHIVCLDIPYPADYGGVFDLFYKITALHKHGIKIHLHCFEYGRGKQDELNKYCEEVNYYKRKAGLKGFSVKVALYS